MCCLVSGALAWFKPTEVIRAIVDTSLRVKNQYFWREDDDLNLKVIRPQPRKALSWAVLDKPFEVNMWGT